ncbi:hypothetical protein [Marinimicrobium sp. LS-A18]|uniref:hypothetical protein n=1 Tax=Marinimicrobium sp. LS-A18 TaxID=1381596 RepID=UPI00046449BD|nr:hypothetical protein [Marinimicrobium sp. LS-A18]
MKILRIVALALLFSSCAVDKKSSEEFRWILTASPEDDAISAAKEGDYRLLGISGMLTEEVPLMDKSCEHGSNVKYLSLDNVIDSYAERRYQAIAPVYAEAYNFHLIKYLRKNGVEICNS